VAAKSESDNEHVPWIAQRRNGGLTYRFAEHEACCALTTGPFAMPEGEQLTTDRLKVLVVSRLKRSTHGGGVEGQGVIVRWFGGVGGKWERADSYKTRNL
jgi:hypothetical protein